MRFYLNLILTLQTAWPQRLVRVFKNLLLIFFSRIRHEDILFTDWLSQNSPESLQLSGVEEVKARIGEYLLKYKIFGKHEKAELQDCLNRQWGNWNELCYQIFCNYLKMKIFVKLLAYFLITKGTSGFTSIILLKNNSIMFSVYIGYRMHKIK